MDQAILDWKAFYNIDDTAFLHLQSILTNGTFLDPYLNTRDSSNVWDVNVLESSDAVLSLNNLQDAMLIEESPQNVNRCPIDEAPHFVVDWSQAPCPNNGSSSNTQSQMDPQRLRGDPCIRCQQKRKKCLSTDSGICTLCSTTKVPRHVCTRERYADYPIFSKWQDADYQSHLEWQHLIWTTSTKPVVLGHHPDGPSLLANCREFEVTSPDQTLLFWKHEGGWNSITTTPFALGTKEVDMDAYVTASVYYFLSRGDYSPHLHEVFQLAESKKTDFLVFLALKLWAANLLLVKGWEIHGPDMLGMSVITDVECSLFGTIPAPRVLQNQLDRGLESFVALTEHAFLKELQHAMLRSKKHTWDAIFVAVVLTLHTRERDLRRLIHWVLNPQGSYRWRHPESAATLIQRSVHLSNLLLNHLHVAGDVPKALYGTEKCFTDNRIEPAYARYTWHDEGSIDLSLSSLAFPKYGRAELAEFGEFGC